MATPSVTHSFTSATTILAAQMNQNFSDVIAAMTDGTGDFAIGSLTVAGTTTLNGDVTLGNATGDDITVTGRVASDLIPKTDSTYDLGSSTLAFAEVYGDAVYADTIQDVAGTGRTHAPKGISGYGAANVTSFSATDILTSTEEDVQLREPLTNSRTLRLPTTDVVAGRTFRVKNMASLWNINVQSSDGDVLATLYPGSSCTFSANQDTPTDQTHWEGLTPIVSPWQAFGTGEIAAITTSWVAGVNGVAYMRRDGCDLLVRIHFIVTGAVTNATWDFDMPTVDGTQLEIDNTALNAQAGTTPIGQAMLFEAGNSTFIGTVVYWSKTQVRIRAHIAGGGGYTEGNYVTQAIPHTWGAADDLECEFRVPVDGWTPFGD